MEEANSEISDLGLTMEVNSGPRCFDLNGDENLMGPDDWAWRFLRLNKHYKNAYQDALQKRQLALSQSPFRPIPSLLDFTRSDEAHRTVLVDEHICRETFGISTWLNPKMKDLPKLATGESWFAPLKTVIAEPRFDGLKAEIFGYRVLHKYLESESESVADDHVHSGEQVCSSTSGRRDPWMNGSVWFAIDCSIPPDGQINSISVIAKKFAAEMADGKLTATAFVQEAFKIKRIDPKGWASNVLSPTAVDERETDAMEMWRLVKVCLVGPVLAQLNKCRVELMQAHVSSLEGKPWRKYFQERFRPLVDGTQEGVGMDGSALKAFLMMAEFNEAGTTDPKTIIRALAKMGAGKDIPPSDAKRTGSPWLDDIEERAILFDNYAKRGQAYVNGGYKWLIHSQNP